MERNAGKRRPQSNSPAKRKSLISSATATLSAGIKWTHGIFGNLRNAIPPLRDIVIVIAITTITFAFGFVVGRGTVQSVLPSDFVTIQEIDIQGTGSHLADVTEDPGLKDIDTSQIAKEEAVTEIEDAPIIQVADANTGVVGPVPTKTPEVKSESPPPQRIASIKKEEMIMPVQGKVVSEFGWRKHPVYEDWRYHTGIDIGVAEGSPVSAVLSGKVVESDSNRELGRYIVIEHPNGIKTKYGHLDSNAVKGGDSVKQGQTIGNAGSSGVTSGSYIHFEVISGGKSGNPEEFL